MSSSKTVCTFDAENFSLHYYLNYLRSITITIIITSTLRLYIIITSTLRLYITITSTLRLYITITSTLRLYITIINTITSTQAHHWPEELLILAQHSSLSGPDGAVNYNYIVTNSIISLLIGSRCIPNGAHTNHC